MLDDFREDAETAAFLDELEDEFVVEEQTISSGRFLGMTPFQRLVIAVMLLFWVSIMGIFLLMISGRIVLPLGF